MVDMTDLKSVEQKSLVWVRLPSPVRWKNGELAQLARALDLHSRGRGFDSLILHIRRSGGMIVCTTIRRSLPRWVVYPKWTSCEYSISPPAP